MSNTLACRDNRCINKNTTDEKTTRPNTVGLLSLAFLGAIVATLCDANHVLTHTLSYPAPFVAGQAWWVFPGFFLAFATMGVTYFLLTNIFRGHLSLDSSQSPGSAQAMMETLVGFAMVYLASGFGNEYPVLLSLIFYGTFVLRWAVSYDRPWLLLLAAIMGIGGMFAEGLMSRFGQVTYRHVDVFLRTLLAGRPVHAWCFCPA